MQGVTACDSIPQGATALDTQQEEHSRHNKRVTTLSRQDQAAAHDYKYKLLYCTSLMIVVVCCFLVLRSIRQRTQLIQRIHGVQDTPYTAQTGAVLPQGDVAAVYTHNTVPCCWCHGNLVALLHAHEPWSETHAAMMIARST
jgi:hypothetical protein